MILTVILRFQMAKNIVIEFDIKANYDYGDMPLLLVINDLRNLMSEVKERIIDIYDKPNAALYTTWDIHVYVHAYLYIFKPYWKQIAT